MHIQIGMIPLIGYKRDKGESIPGRERKALEQLSCKAHPQRRAHQAML